jgi:hypothetical protein
MPVVARARRWVVTIVTSLAVVIACAAVGPVPAALGQTTSRAVVIVDMGTLGGGVHTSVIQFSGSVTGLEALQLAGASPGTVSYGALGEAVCTLYGRGDDPASCPHGWVYSRAVGGATGWTQSGFGASNTTVHDGDVEGWRYGGGAPPFSSFCAVAGCAPPPTSPPTNPPPATNAPSVGGTGGSVGVAGVTTTTAPAGAPNGATDTTAQAGAAETTGTTTTTVAGARGSSGDHRADGRLAAGAPTTGASGGDGGGSPIGVIVAGVIVALLVGGGVVLRRRRRAA